MDIRVINKIHERILKESTGTPKELAYALNVSERTVYNYIKFMRLELKAPIIYNRIKDTYEYETICNINFIHIESF
ncbi:HTH domain-containing protein [Siansivirga zeaxanthinifaciens]|uniref:Helix-turn-helix type 11 domain-containing protein n=1 Tax=Siansivirga zeaxanthinifaciens CC-SAMT-1 TaxID=1454006 RepID=A0A0C5W090_9FLAO|nr:HTH domain-containing protein [Siansivirga zeaxanthinifaciens]AJR04686.1 hypothetical protein AW14_14755 [Siansivirga zeaxanthinifaciens CC-SAMT-1]